MVLGLYGKHPAKGDFLEAGLPAPLLRLVETWLDSALADVRDVLGAEWQGTWDRAPMLRFWLGEGLWGAPVAGILAASKDKVGRRFPLMVLVGGQDAPAPPVLAADQNWHDAAAAHLAQCLMLAGVAAPVDLLTGLCLPADAEGISAASPAEFWAVQPGTDPAGLWADVAATDHRRAAAGRSYWWVAGEAPTALAPVVETETAVVTDPAPTWDLPPPPDASEDIDSPFADGTAPGIFAAPVVATPDVANGAAHEAALAPAPAARGPEVRPALWSQVWAGPGLPSGAVLAWLLRGHVGHD